MGRGLCNIFSFKCNRTALRGDQPGYGMECRRLARAVGADQCDDFPLAYLKRYPFNGLDHSIIDFQVPDFKHCHTLTLLFSQIRRDDFRILKYFGSFPACQYLTEIQNSQFLTNAGHQLHIMFDQQDCHLKFIPHKTDHIH